MRFDRLDLVRYGALTGRRLTFRPDARLHIVYGPNEAGKSSALSAISDLLFGFPERSDYDFLHDSSSLRIAAQLTSSNGTSLAYRRRKGRKNTLLRDDDAEEALGDDVLAPFTGTLSRDVFQRAFGLDSASLRAGGETMLKSGGEIGSLLFSAASGLTGLSGVRKSLDAEADAIYSQRRSKDRRFYQVLDAHENARKAERELELRASDWKKIIAEEAELVAGSQAVQDERSQTKRALDRLNRMLRLEPILRDIDRENERLGRHQLSSALADGAEGDIASLIERRRLADEAGRAAEDEIGRLRREIAAVNVDAALIEAAPRIAGIYARIGVYLNARQDMPRVTFEVDDLSQRLLLAARRLGLTGVEELERAQPSDADLVRLREAVERGNELDRSLTQLLRRIEGERDALGKLDNDLGMGRIADPKSWSETLSALRPDLNELSVLDTLKIRHSRAESDLAAAATRLDPPVSDIRLILAVPLPDIDVLSARKHAIDAAKSESQKISQRVVELEQEAGELGLELASLEMRGEIVSREVVLAARGRREQWLDRVASGDAGPDVVSQMRETVKEADRLADLALTDAERMSRYAQIDLRKREVEHRLLSAKAAAKEAAISASDTVTEFEDLFHSAPIVPSTPERMIEWRRSLERIAPLLAAVDDARDALDVLRLKEEELRPALQALADAAGLLAANMPVSALARAIERKLEELTAVWNERRSLERLRTEAARKLAMLEDEEGELRRQVDEWRRGYAGAVSLVGLADDASMDMALAALDVWRSVPGMIDERENRARRVNGMARDMRQFEDAVRSLCAELSETLASLPAELAAGALNDRLVEERSAVDRRSVLMLALARSEAAKVNADQEAEASVARLTEFATAAGVDVDRLGELLEDMNARKSAQALLEEARDRFRERANGLSEADARAELSGFDRVDAEMEIERLEGEDARQVESLKMFGIAQADNDRRRRALETGIGAERAVFEKKSAEEEARELGRRWVVLKLAGELLAESMEAYRERQADPIMTRAGQLFASLTGGRFSRLVQLYDTQDELQLAVERISGERVPLAGLSEGTGDQLYLALRLAFIEDYCRRNEPVPLVLDDIFQTFDDERTTAGLHTLSETGGNFQAILFTHQMSLVTAAEKALGESVDLIRLDAA